MVDIILAGGFGKLGQAIQLGLKNTDYRIVGILSGHQHESTYPVWTTRSDINFELAQPAMTGEDFGYLLQHIPGVMLWLGVNDSHPLHSAQLTIDESALLPGYNALKSFLLWRMATSEEK